MDAGGAGGTGGRFYEDPLPADEPITLGCVADLLPIPFVARWELSVDPTPIPAMTPFVARLGGTIVVSEFAIDESQSFIGGGFKRCSVEDVSATVHVHGSARESSPGAPGKPLTRPAVSYECTYDQFGQVGPNAGPAFPKCEPTNDNPDGSNRDCTGLREGPHPENRCGQFVTIPTSDDCDECDEVYGRRDDCNSLGFCVTGDLRIPLEASDGFYEAEEAGEVFFGFEETKGTELAAPHFESDPGPNGFRVRLQGIQPLAVECTMVGSGSSLFRFDPVSAADFISFTVQEP